MEIYKESLVKYIIELSDGSFYSKDKGKCYSMFTAEIFNSISDVEKIALQVKGDIRKVKMVDIGSASLVEI